MLIKINKEYHHNRLREVASNPFTQFNEWFQEACAVLPTQLVNSMVLSTVSSESRPSSRIVLLKEYTDSEFIFYTNYESRKGQEISQHPSVCLLFWWEAMERQVRIEGVAQKISDVQSEDYFHSRLKSSQIAAIASRQSQPLETLDVLQSNFKELCERYAAAETIVPRPLHWGGYAVTPDRFEFWQGRENRLHDRFQYTRTTTAAWHIVRLYP